MAEDRELVDRLRRRDRDALRQIYEKCSVGDPTPHPDPRTRFLQVPCEVELRVGGETHVRTFTPNIRAVYNQPDRWVIGGGI